MLLKGIDVFLKRRSRVILEGIGLPGGLAFRLDDQLIQHCLGGHFVSGQRHTTLDSQGVAKAAPPLL